MLRKERLVTLHREWAQSKGEPFYISIHVAVSADIIDCFWTVLTNYQDKVNQV